MSAEVHIHISMCIKYTSTCVRHMGHITEQACCKLLQGHLVDGRLVIWCDHPSGYTAKVFVQIACAQVSSSVCICRLLQGYLVDGHTFLSTLLVRRSVSLFLATY